MQQRIPQYAYNKSRNGQIPYLCCHLVYRDILKPKKKIKIEERVRMRETVSVVQGLTICTTLNIVDFCHFVHRLSTGYIDNIFALLMSLSRLKFNKPILPSCFSGISVWSLPLSLATSCDRRAGTHWSHSSTHLYWLCRYHNIQRYRYTSILVYGERYSLGRPNFQSKYHFTSLSLCVCDIAVLDTLNPFTTRPTLRMPKMCILTTLTKFLGIIYARVPTIWSGIRRLRDINSGLKIMCVFIFL